MLPRLWIHVFTSFMCCSQESLESKIRPRNLYCSRGCQLKKILVHPRIFSKKSLKNPKNQKNQKIKKIPKIPKFQEFWFNKSTKFYKNRFFSLSILIPLTVLIIPLGLLSVSWSVCCQCHARNF